VDQPVLSVVLDEPKSSDTDEQAKAVGEQNKTVADKSSSSGCASKKNINFRNRGDGKTSGLDLGFFSLYACLVQVGFLLCM
jgi:hypothetical protein